MNTPSLDIIIPIWNNPVEARSCLASLISSIDIARLIIINNGCGRDTELMLEEFSDTLGERAIYMTMERNIGFVPAVNRALERSDADWALVVRPGTSIENLSLKALLDAAEYEQAGIITPLSNPDKKLSSLFAKSGCDRIETCELSFSAIMLSGRMRQDIGLFDENLDNDRWCLQDYRYRAESFSYHTVLVPGTQTGGEAPVMLGSQTRRMEKERQAAFAVESRWGRPKQYAVYFPRETDPAYLSEAMQIILRSARRGNKVTVMLHKQQFRQIAENSFNCLHTGVDFFNISFLFPLRSLWRQVSILRQLHPHLQIIQGVDGIPFPGENHAASLSSIERVFEKSSDTLYAKRQTAEKDQAAF